MPCSRAPKRGVGQGTFCMPLAGGSWSDLGSTLLFLGCSGMQKSPGTIHATSSTLDAEFPFDAATWRRLVETLGLSEQQARIVELIIQGHRDKRIAEELGLRRATIRTYLMRIFSRVGAKDRIGLVVRVFTAARSL